jgi:flavodoxin/formate hydrogenlyase subunit 6/NADH:ubiquinone oxidoreductase subunit I
MIVIKKIIFFYISSSWDEQKIYIILSCNNVDGKKMVKACIIYFSQTGNTENIAFSIAGKLMSMGASVIPMHLYDYEDFPDALDDADIVGIGFPTFFGYPPLMITELIKGMKSGEGKNAFVFTTYGGITAGDSLYDAAKGLSDKGYKIAGGLKIIGAHSYPQALALKLNAGRPNKNDMELAEEFAEKVMDAYSSGRSISPDKLASSTKFFVEKRDKSRKKTVDGMRKKVEGTIKFSSELCLFCETCKKSCPTKSITTGEKFPVFSWNCIDGLKCYQCVRSCPGKALSVEYPGSPEDYIKFMEIAEDSEEEKNKAYIVA